MEPDTDLPVGGFLTETDNRCAFVVTPRGWGCIRRGPIRGSFVEEDGLVAFCWPDCSYPSSSVALEDSSKMAHVVVQPQPHTHTHTCRRMALATGAKTRPPRTLGSPWPPSTPLHRQETDCGGARPSCRSCYNGGESVSRQETSEIR